MRIGFASRARRVIVVLCIISAPVAAPTMAADNGFYLGAGITESKLDNIGGSVDLNDTRFKLIAGLRPLDWLGPELNYFDLGRDDTSTALGTTRVKSRALAAFAVGYLGLDPAPIDLFVKAGLARWRLEGDLGSALGNVNLAQDGNEFAYGAGVQARLGSLALRLEYESFEVENTTGATLYSLGVSWTFL